MAKMERTIPAIAAADATEYAAILERFDKGLEVDATDLINALTWRTGNQRRELAKLNTEIGKLKEARELAAQASATMRDESVAKSARIAELEAEAKDDRETNEDLRGRLKEIESERLTWAMACECCCPACKKLDALIRA